MNGEQTVTLLYTVPTIFHVVISPEKFSKEHITFEQRCTTVEHGNHPMSRELYAMPHFRNVKPLSHRSQ